MIVGATYLPPDFFKHHPDIVVVGSHDNREYLWTLSPGLYLLLLSAVTISCIQGATRSGILTTERVSFAYLWTLPPGLYQLLLF